MKYTFLLLLSALILTSCEPVKKNSDKKESPKTTFEFKQANSKFQSIALSEDGDLRGLDIGVGIDKLQDLEKFLLLEDDFYKHYQIDLNSYEFFDLIYYKYDNKLDEITVDVHLENDIEALEIHDDFVQWLSAKYGEPLLDYNGDLIWNKSVNDSTVVSFNLKMVSTFPDADKAGLEKKIELGIITLSK